MRRAWPIAAALVLSTVLAGCTTQNPNETSPSATPSPLPTAPHGLINEDTQQTIAPDAEAVWDDQSRAAATDVDSIHDVAAKYYRLIFVDSGNDESDPMWLRMIDLADQIVVATTTRADHAEAGALLLEALAERDERSARLAHNAVTVISQADPKATAADMQHVADGYSTLTRAVVQIPHDPALVDGQLSYEPLRPATQRAWLAAGAAVANGLGGRS